MTDLLNHFSLQGSNWDSSLPPILLLVWLGVLFCIVSSILSQPFDQKQRIFWILLIILLPIIGVLAYLPFAFRKDDLPPIFLRKKRRNKKGPPSNSSSES